MKMLQSVVRWFKAKDAELSDKIEKEHEVEFAKQDMESMQKDLAQVTNNVGEVKATIAGLKRDKSDKERMLNNLEEDARALLDKGKEKLATRLCEDIEILEAEIEVFAQSIAQQENMLKTLDKKRRQLQDAARQAESSLRMMETMDAVSRASEKISTVKVGDTTNALSRFQQRQNRLQKRLDKAKALAEINAEDSGENLNKEVNEALGRGKGSRALARLKKQSQ